MMINNNNNNNIYSNNSKKYYDELHFLFFGTRTDEMHAWAAAVDGSLSKLLTRE